MLALYILVGLCGLAVAGFLLEPFVRDEWDITPQVLWPERGSRTDATGDSRDADVSTKGRNVAQYERTAEKYRCCPHCGEGVERGYVFCGNCAGPLPTPA